MFYIRQFVYLLFFNLYILTFYALNDELTFSNNYINKFSDIPNSIHPFGYFFIFSQTILNEFFGKIGGGLILFYLMLISSKLKYIILFRKKLFKLIFHTFLKKFI